MRTGLGGIIEIAVGDRRTMWLRGGNGDARRSGCSTHVKDGRRYQKTKTHIFLKPVDDTAAAAEKREW